MPATPSLCVQHHPARAHLIPPLRARLGEFELVADPDPDGARSPLRTYLECLRRTPNWATHRIVIQDDAWPCQNFQSRALEAVAERPDSPIAFFVPGLKSAGARRMADALRKGERWAQIGGTAITPLVALAWPAGLIEDFIRFATSQRIASRYTHDDPVATLFVKSRKLDVWATVPSLVEHPDAEPSLIDKPHGAGRFRHRVAAFYTGDS